MNEVIKDEVVAPETTKTAGVSTLKATVEPTTENTAHATIDKTPADTNTITLKLEDEPEFEISKVCLLLYIIGTDVLLLRLSIVMCSHVQSLNPFQFFSLLCIPI